MNKNQIWVTCFVALFAISVVASSSFFVDASAESVESEQNNTPRYSETCAHGHNGFDCKPSQYNELENRVSELEQRISLLE